MRNQEEMEFMDSPQRRSGSFGCLDACLPCGGCFRWIRWWLRPRASGAGELYMPLLMEDERDAVTYLLEHIEGNCSLVLPVDLPPFMS